VDVNQLLGREVISSDGESLGQVEDVYVDPETGEPEFLMVASGLLKRRRHAVPASGLTDMEETVQIPFGKEEVKDAPTVEADGELSEAEEEALYRHYQGSDDHPRSHTDEADDGDDVEQVDGGDADSRATDAMTRSEEELRIVGHQRRPRERVRLRKHQVTEYVTMRVPVTRDEVKVEHEPIDETADPATGEQDSGTAVTLSSEEPIVEKRVVPKERIRLGAETVTEDEQVSADVRKEHVDVEGDSALIKEDDHEH
jgi:uncharacterized protein (TIGR02271 family)